MLIGTITCSYFTKIYGYKPPKDLDWGKMCQKWRDEFSEEEFLKLAAGIKELGFDSIEIWEPTYSFYKYTEKDAAGLAQKLHTQGFKKIAYCIGGWGASGVKDVDKAYSFAKALGAEVVVGCITKPDADVILPVIEKAGKKYGLRYAIESHPAPNFEAPEDIAEATKPYSTIGCNLETGLLYAGGHDPVKAIDTLKGKIYHVHCKDMRKGSNDCFPLSEGEVPLAKVLARLQDIEYKGMLSVEFEYHDDPTPGLKKSIEFIRKNLR
jgi:sugar phosphate isomerase/epimerase